MEKEGGGDRPPIIFPFSLYIFVTKKTTMGVKGFAVWLAAEYPAAFMWGEPAPPPAGRGGGGGGGGRGGGAPTTDFAARRSGGFGGYGGGAAAAAQRGESVAATSTASRLPPSFDHMYVDMAGLLHTALRQGKRRRTERG